MKILTSLNKWVIISSKSLSLSNKIEMLPKSSEDKNPEETASASYPKLRMQFTYNLVCDVIEFICNLKLFKAIKETTLMMPTAS